MTDSIRGGDLRNLTATATQLVSVIRTLYLTLLFDHLPREDETACTVCTSESD